MSDYASLERSSSKPTLVLAGASGFIGKALAAALAARFHVVGISRSARHAEASSSVCSGCSEWRSADLFNLREAEHALRGARYAIYLVHSMLPSARLTQGSFADFDLICADNFARAAARAGVEQIVYLGGLVPRDGALSPHLASRLEVEATLGRYGVPLTTLRAGLVIGGGGSSFEILVRLVERLPAMVCPRWTLTKMQPVAVDDVVKLLGFVVGRPDCFGQTYDVGAPEALSYRDLMTMCARILGLRRPMLPVRFVSPTLSRLWITLVTGAPKALVAPLVESLRHEMIARDLRLAELAGLEPTPVRKALELALEERAPNPFPSAHDEIRKSGGRVRSVQRMRLPREKNADWAAAEYVRWLPTLLRGLVGTKTSPNRDCRFVVPFCDVPLLDLKYATDRNTPDRQLFFIDGGVLTRAGARGRFELRQALDERTLITAIHDYAPRLPWYVYRATQARVHALVMAAFRAHLRAMTRDEG